MASTSLTFRCPDEVLEAIDNLGKERYPADTRHGCDRSKTLLDIMRAGIEALNDGSIVLPAPAENSQQPSNVRRVTSNILSDSELEERITEIVERKTEQAKAELRAELLGESAA